MSDVLLSGNLTMDVQSLQAMVDQGGAKGNKDIQDFAFAVLGEAQKAGAGQEAQAASNLAYSLSDGTYSQGASNAALFASLQGKSVDSAGLGIENTRNRIVAGDSSADIAHDLDALGTEIGGDSGAKLKEFAGQVANGQMSAGGAMSLLNQLGQQHGLSDVKLASDESGPATNPALMTSILGAMQRGMMASMMLNTILGGQNQEASKLNPVAKNNENNT